MTTTDCLMLIGSAFFITCILVIAGAIRGIMDWDRRVINALSKRIEKLESAAKPARSANGRFCGKGNAKNE